MLYAAKSVLDNPSASSNTSSTRGHAQLLKFTGAAAARDRDQSGEEKCQSVDAVEEELLAACTSMSPRGYDWDRGNNNIVRYVQ